MTDEERDKLYLIDIKERIERIESFTQGGQTAFEQSYLIQDAVLRNLEVIGEAAGRISDTLKRERSSVPWRMATRLRNFVIHGYDRVDLDIIWRTITQDLPQLKRSVGDILLEIESNQS